MPALLFKPDVWREARARFGGDAEAKRRLQIAIDHITPVRNEIAHVREVAPENCSGPILRALHALTNAQSVSSRKRDDRVLIPYTESPKGLMPLLDWSQCPAVESIPGKVSGAWVLRNTRMPVATILENLEAGANIDDILASHDGLDRDQVKAVIEFAVSQIVPNGNSG